MKFTITSCLLCLETLAAETGGRVKLDGLGGVVASRQDKELPISLDNGNQLELERL